MQRQILLMMQQPYIQIHIYILLHSLKFLILNTQVLVSCQFCNFPCCQLLSKISLNEVELSLKFKKLKTGAVPIPAAISLSLCLVLLLSGTGCLILSLAANFALSAGGSWGRGTKSMNIRAVRELKMFKNREVLQTEQKQGSIALCKLSRNEVGLLVRALIAATQPVA